MDQIIIPDPLQYYVFLASGYVCYIDLWCSFLLFLTVAQHNQVPEKNLFWSVTLYNKNVSCQCNLTAQISPVHNKEVINSGESNQRLIDNTYWYEIKVKESQVALHDLCGFLLNTIYAVRKVLDFLFN